MGKPDINQRQVLLCDGNHAPFGVVAEVSAALKEARHRLDGDTPGNLCVQFQKCLQLLYAHVHGGNVEKAMEVASAYVPLLREVKLLDEHNRPRREHLPVLAAAIKQYAVRYEFVPPMQSLRPGADKNKARLSLVGLGNPGDWGEFIKHAAARGRSTADWDLAQKQKGRG